MNRYATRLWAALLALSLLFSLAACGRETTTATTMHLKRTEGTVTVSDDDGKDVPLLEDLGLYSGYGVDTRSKSYAWIDLDDVKLAKLDQRSEIAIQKEGKSLEIEIISGSLFFNVTKPLEEDETMDIRTSTMLVGIRGTCGWVEDRKGLSRVYLLEGTVECSAKGQTVRVNAGEMAELTENGNLVVQTFTARDIPAFVQDDLTRDPDLCSDIYEASGLDVLENADGEDFGDDILGTDGEEVFEDDILETDGVGEAGEDFGDDILAALENAESGDVITLTRDYDTQTAAYVNINGGSKDNPVILDLNGHTLTVTGIHHLLVYGALQIRDSSTGGGTMDLGVFITLEDSAYLCLDSGTIEGPLLRLLVNSTFTMNGGTVRGRVEPHNDSSFTMNDGTVDGAVETYDDSSFIMNGGTVNDGVYTWNNSTFTPNGGEVYYLY